MNVKNLIRPVYLFRRLWYRLYELQHPDEPWISQRAVRFCEQLLNPQDHAGLEWGSGRSTTWYAAHLQHLTSVEHNRHWYNLVDAKLKHQGVQNIDYLFVPLDHDEREPTYPHYEQLPQYVRVAEGFEDDQLDFVVVDGHYRQACIRAALPKLSHGGLLLVDNSNWLPLNQWGVPNDWKLVHQSSNVMSETSIWQKP